MSETVLRLVFLVVVIAGACGVVFIVQSIVHIANFLLSCPISCVMVFFIEHPMRAWVSVATGCFSRFSYRLCCFSVGFSDPLDDSVATGCSGYFCYHLHCFSANFRNFLYSMCAHTGAPKRFFVIFAKRTVWILIYVNVITFQINLLYFVI